MSDKKMTCSCQIGCVNFGGPDCIRHRETRDNQMREEGAKAERENFAKSLSELLKFESFMESHEIIEALQFKVKSLRATPSKQDVK